MKKNKYLISSLYLILSCFLIFPQNTSLEKTSDNIVPIIFIHLGYGSELEHSLWQALQYNKNVILISDDENNKHGLDVQYYDLTPFKKEADQFACEYVHLTTTTERCSKAVLLSHIQRWFILKEFMEYHNIPICFQCDSDVMIYTNITDRVKMFEPCDFALVTGRAYSPLSRRLKSLTYVPRFSDCTVLIRKEVLVDYCTFLHKFYKDKDNIKKLTHLNQLNRIPSIGGMFLITRYMDMTDAAKKFIIKNICEVIDNTVFDSSLDKSFDGQFEMGNEKGRKWKNIKWLNNKPYCYNKVLDKMIGFNTLHFSGRKKYAMPNYKRKKILD